jgi:hypothetical protein
VSEELDDRDVALAVLLEAGQVLGDPVGEAKRAALHQDPDRARRDHLGVGVEEPERIVPGRHAIGIEPRVAERLDERKLPAPGDRDLGRGVAAFGQMARDDLNEAIERLGIEAEGDRVGWGEGNGHDDVLVAHPLRSRRGLG